MLDMRLPDLTFPGLSYGKREIPWDLKRWLYKGGARVPAKSVAEIIKSGQLGEPLLDRIELVRQVHEVLLNYLEGGGSRSTIQSRIETLNRFFKWADQSKGYHLSLASLEQIYRHWCDTLLHRVRVGRELKEQAAYDYGNKVGWVLDRVLGREILGTGNPIIKTTRLRKPKPSPRAVSPKADKQNLEETFAFGHFLLDLADGLGVDAIWGPLPLHIPLRNGKTLEECSGLKRSATLKPFNNKWVPQARQAAKLATMKRAAWEAEKSYRTRYPLINLRIQAEMFMLMGQPAVNLAQAHQLRMDQWRYKASTHGYEIRTYKHRRWGPVVFEIYSEYREIFERYLKWRKAIFPDDPDGLLFPLLSQSGGELRRRPDRPPEFDILIKACNRAGVKYLPPSALRNTNVNWMLRRTQDPELTAAEKQHTRKTLLGTYEKPSLQLAMVQTQVFWAKYDPALAAVGPGSCPDKTPNPVSDIPATATKPDCRTPAGCLFCDNQRDIDSFDHVWSLTSYRLLKSFELGGQPQAKSKIKQPKHPAEAAIERITAKLAFIEAFSPEHAAWVKEAQLRLEEERYHPDWAGMIESL